MKYYGKCQVSLRRCTTSKCTLSKLILLRYYTSTRLSC
nr:MAG TPA: hypothetical protein [Bacteriophage sp.]